MHLLTRRYGGLIFFALTLLYILADVSKTAVLQMAVKPLLIPSLLIFFLVNMPAGASRNLICAALLFSFAGDVLLLFEHLQPSLFVPGLLCFLFTHILYIVYFLRIKPRQVSLLRTAPYIIPLIMLYVYFLLRLLFPLLGAMKFPVTIYALVIISMLLVAIHIYTRVDAETGKYFIAGATLFVLSDSLLAINKFYAPLHLPFLIMLTYCLAQYLIVSGVIKRAAAEINPG